MPLKITRPKGRGYWYIVGSVAGVRVRESAKTTSRAVAESLRIKRESELEQRRIHGPQAVATFAEAVNLYLDRNGESRFLGPVLERFGPMRLADISQADLDAARQLYPGAAVSTLNRQLYTPFVAVYNEAAVNGLCPPRLWRRPKGHNRKTKFRWLWPEEFQAVWEAAPFHGRVALDLFAGTGLRESEGLGLEWGDVALSLGQAWIWTPKNDEPRRIELPSRTIAALANLDHREGTVLLDGGGGSYVLQAGGGGALATGLACWARDANVEPFGAHVLRHTFATWFYSATLDRERLKALGGWKSEEVGRYCHLAPRGLGAELERFGWDFSRRNESGIDCANFAPATGDVRRLFTSEGDASRQLLKPEKEARRQ